MHGATIRFIVHFVLLVLYFKLTTYNYSLPQQSNLYLRLMLVISGPNVCSDSHTFHENVTYWLGILVLGSDTSGCSLQVFLSPI